MPIDTETPRSPGWWTEMLAIKLHDRRQGRSGNKRYTRDQVASSTVRPPLTLLDDYRRGDPPLRSDIHTEWASEFRRFVRMGRLHVAPILYRATGNRMGIRDFRTAAAQDELGDVEARNIMRANNLKLLARDVHDNMLSLGDAYTLVTPPDDVRSYPLITSESPLECITANDSATGQVLAGLKMFRDEWDEADWAYLYLREDTEVNVYVARMDGPTSIFGEKRFRMLRETWYWDRVSEQIPGGRMPINRFRNRDGVGEFEQHLDHLDRINDKLFNEWWISKVQAFRQRAIENLPDYDAGGELVNYAGMFTSAPDALWRLPEGAKIWESTVVDIGPLINSIQRELQWIAVTKGIPLHTITPDAANGSAEGASLMREEHVEHIGDRRDRAEGSWATTMATAFAFQGDTERADVTQIEPIWGPIERYSLEAKAAATAQVWGKLPAESIFTDIWQYSPADISRLRQQAGNDLLYGSLQEVPAAPAPTVPDPNPPASGR